MSEESLQGALEVAVSAAKATGSLLRPHFGKIEAESKSSTGDAVVDIVTRLDGEAEKLLQERLAVFNESFGFRGEEYGISREGKTTWLVDPIDGTGHFVRGIPYCTVMIALIEHGEVLLSVIYDFIGDNMYTAIKGGGAFCNGMPIQVSSRTLAQSLFAFETRLEQPENTELYLQFRQACGGIINFLASGYDFIQIATGKIEGKITKQPYGLDWDFAPGSLLVEEAGGVVANHGQDKYSYTNHNFIATNRIIYDELTNDHSALFPTQQKLQ